MLKVEWIELPKSHAQRLQDKYRCAERKPIMGTDRFRGNECRCSRLARFYVGENSTPLCTQHAGAKALEYILENQDV